MIDLHTHTTFSDGVLIPFELARRLAVSGHKVVAITDHGDFSNIEWIVTNVTRACKEISNYFNITLIPGIELTHIPPELFSKLTREARKMGAKIVVAHGESPVEPVAEGTNISAIKASVDILAHPGLITDKEVKLAVKKGVALEISARKGHSLCNGHVAKLALKHGAKLVINSDGHAPGDYLTEQFRYRVGMGAGLTTAQYNATEKNALAIVKQALSY
jgi:histidinol phosphatase-like PHP family hydrolase